MPGCKVRHFYWQIVQAVEHHVRVSMEVTGSSPVLPANINKVSERVKVTENWASTLRGMKVGETVIFPISSISSVNTTISRLRLEMCVEGADWKRVGEIDRKHGEFKVKRVS